MTPRELDGSILVCIDDAAAARVMRSLLPSFAASQRLFLLFAHEGLVDVLGATRHPHGFDSQACLLNPERFSLVLTFASLQQGTASGSGAWLAGYFQEVGVPTVELQRHLFQLGFPPLCAAVQRAGSHVDAAGSTVLWQYAAGQLLAWAGTEGIGAPVLALGHESAAKRDDLICVTSALDHATCSDQERYKFTIAVLRLAMAHPELSLCWVVRAEELAHVQAAPLLRMITDAALPNLWIESSESAQTVIRRARFGIAMPSTALLDHAREGTPVLLHAGALYDALPVGKGLAAPFGNYFELEQSLPQIAAEPERFLFASPVRDLDPTQLAQQLGAAMARRALRSDWREIAMRYLTQLQLLELRARPAPKSDQADMPAVEMLSKKLSAVLERLGVIQRSTVGYKALKLVKRLKGGGG